MRDDTRNHGANMHVRKSCCGRHVAKLLPVIRAGGDVLTQP